MKVTQMPPVHAANLVANSGNTAYGVDVIIQHAKGQINPLFLWTFIFREDGLEWQGTAHVNQFRRPAAFRLGEEDIVS